MRGRGRIGKSTAAKVVAKRPCPRRATPQSSRGRISIYCRPGGQGSNLGQRGREWWWGGCAAGPRGRQRQERQGVQAGRGWSRWVSYREILLKLRALQLLK